MKKALALILTLVMLLSCMSVTAFAAEYDKSGDTTITATKAAPFSYEIVIPENVTGITAAGVYEVGQAKVTGVTGATDNTVISYTAETTDFKCEGKTDIPATYYTEEAATNAFPTDAVTVYENKAEAASIPSMWVKIAESDWNAAEAGTYTATVTFNFSAEEAAVVTYMDWDSVNKKLVEDKTTDYIEIKDNTTTTLEGGKFYVVKGTDVQTGTLTVTGTGAATLILMDGAELTAHGGIVDASDKALVITGQSGGTGALIATGGDNGAGIGGGNGGTGGTITINGGTITANGGNSGAGIGGGNGGNGGIVTINGGTVTAKGGDSGAGIGGGNGGNGGIVTINGGTVTAKGGGEGAGIGGGGYSGNGGTVTVNGGTVTATGNNFAAGIGGGGGAEGAGGTVNINGGTVTATGKNGGAAIGAGANDDSHGTVTFGEGIDFTVYAGDTAPGSEMTTTEYATEDDHSAAYVKITPAALGETYTVTFDTQGHGSIQPRTGVISGSTIFAPIVPLDAGYTFDGWYKEAACTNAWNFDTDTVTADTTLYAKWTMQSPK